MLALLESPVWRESLSLPYDGGVQQVSLRNFAGPNFPALFDQAMTSVLAIQPSERVVDIGGGDAPFQRADMVTDAFLSEGVHRSGRGLLNGREYVQAFAEELPFADHEFDFAWCRMVLEHTVDPARACAEMQRVARRGFIETPSPFGEYLQPNPTHRWLVSVEEGELVFRPKPFRRSPFLHMARALWFSDAAFRYAWEVAYRNLVCTQFYWENGFAYRVEEASSTDFDYHDPEQAAEAHLDQALNALRTGSVPLPLVYADIEEAIRQRPNWAIAYNTQGCCLWKEGRFDEARAAFRQAAALEPSNLLYAVNQSLAVGQTPRLLWLPDNTEEEGVR